MDMFDVDYPYEAGLRHKWLVWAL